jgi:hypothetical protein
MNIPSSTDNNNDNDNYRDDNNIWFGLFILIFIKQLW